MPLGIAFSPMFPWCQKQPKKLSCVEIHCQTVLDIIPSENNISRWQSYMLLNFTVVDSLRLGGVSILGLYFVRHKILKFKYVNDSLYQAFIKGGGGWINSATEVKKLNDLGQ